MIWVAVDAMGGDAAPGHVVDGALAAAHDVDLGLVLVGPAARIEAELARYPHRDTTRVRIIDAADVVGMEEAPAAGAWGGRGRRRFDESRQPRYESPPKRLPAAARPLFSAPATPARR